MGTYYNSDLAKFYFRDAAVQIMDVDSTVQGVIEDRAITGIY